MIIIIIILTKFLSNLLPPGNIWSYSSMSAISVSLLQLIRLHFVGFFLLDKVLCSLL